MFGEKITKDGFVIEKCIDYYRVILKDRNLFVVNSLHYKIIATGVKILVGEINNPAEEVVQKVIFDPTKFTMQEALDWAIKKYL